VSTPKGVVFTQKQQHLKRARLESMSLLVERGASNTKNRSTKFEVRGMLSTRSYVGCSTFRRRRFSMRCTNETLSGSASELLLGGMPPETRPSSPFQRDIACSLPLQHLNAHHFEIGAVDDVRTTVYRTDRRSKQWPHYSTQYEPADRVSRKSLNGG